METICEFLWCIPIFQSLHHCGGEGGVGGVPSDLVNLGRLDKGIAFNVVALPRCIGFDSGCDVAFSEVGEVGVEGFLEFISNS